MKDGLLLAYRYRSKAVLPDDGPRLPEPDYTQYVPSARPGDRAPHCWLDDHETSTVDLHRDGFSLVGPDPDLGAARRRGGLRTRPAGGGTARHDRGCGPCTPR